MATETTIHVKLNILTLQNMYPYVRYHAHGFIGDNVRLSSVDKSFPLGYPDLTFAEVITKPANERLAMLETFHNLMSVRFRNNIEHYFSSVINGIDETLQYDKHIKLINEDEAEWWIWNIQGLYYRRDMRFDVKITNQKILESGKL